MGSNHSNVLFFDGVCNLCNGFVDFLIRCQKTKKIYFSPLQGNTAKIILPEGKISNLDSVVYYRDGKVFEQSRAVLYVLSDTLFLGKVFLVFLIIPSPIRDFIYRKIANSRYHLFGRRTHCRLPTSEERALFLD